MCNPKIQCSYEWLACCVDYLIELVNDSISDFAYGALLNKIIKNKVLLFSTYLWAKYFIICCARLYYTNIMYTRKYENMQPSSREMSPPICTSQQPTLFQKFSQERSTAYYIKQELINRTFILYKAFKVFSFLKWHQILRLELRTNVFPILFAQRSRGFLYAYNKQNFIRTIKSFPIHRSIHHKPPSRRQKCIKSP